jgi:hypothetical protein
MAFISNGTTILDNGAFNVNLGSMVLLSEQTASSSANISFTSGIDSTYPIYKFEFIDIHPSVNNTNLEFNLSIDGGSNYNVTKTSTFVFVTHNESSTETVLSYSPASDLAQSTSNQRLSLSIGTDNDQSGSGYLHLFNPSSTTFVKHFISRSDSYSHDDYSRDGYSAGYGNTTSAVDAIQFSMSSGNIDDGIIKMYGIKDS